MKSKSVVTSVGVGLAAGGMAAALTAMKSPSMKKTVSKKAGQVMKQMSSMIDDMSYLFK